MSTTTKPCEVIAYDTPIGHREHQFGFDYCGLIRVVRGCDGRGWALVSIRCANGDEVDVVATKRTCKVGIVRKPKNRRRAGK